MLAAISTVFSFPGMFLSLHFHVPESIFGYSQERLQHFAVVPCLDADIFYVYEYCYVVIAFYFSITFTETLFFRHFLTPFINIIHTICC